MKKLLITLLTVGLYTTINCMNPEEQIKTSVNTSTAQPAVTTADQGAVSSELMASEEIDPESLAELEKLLKELQLEDLTVNLGQPDVEEAEVVIADVPAKSAELANAASTVAPAELKDIQTVKVEASQPVAAV